MNKKEAIDSINGLYPIDSNFPDTNEVGEQFMLEAMDELGFNWRDLPENILVRWAEKCEARETEQDRKMSVSYK
jgi:hypothetical protein